MPPTDLRQPNNSLYGIRLCSGGNVARYSSVNFARTRARSDGGPGRTSPGFSGASSARGSVLPKALTGTASLVGVARRPPFDRAGKSSPAPNVVTRCDREPSFTKRRHCTASYVSTHGPAAMSATPSASGARRLRTIAHDRTRSIGHSTVAGFDVPTRRGKRVARCPERSSAWGRDHESRRRSNRRRAVPDGDPF